MVPHYKSMATVSCHNNQSTYPIEIYNKTPLFISPAYRCYTRNLVRIGSMASKEMAFEMLTDGRRRRRMTDA